MAPISRILLSSAAVTLDRTAGSDDFFRHLKLNQVLKAKVLKVLSPRQAMLSIGGKAVRAQTFVPVTEGEAVLLKTTATGPQPRFALLDPLPAATGREQSVRLALLEKNGAFDTLAALLKTGLDPVGGPAEKARLEILAEIKQLLLRVARKGEIGSHTFLKDLIRSSGLLWEQKLSRLALSPPGRLPEAQQDLPGNDLKGLALQLLNRLTDQDDAAARLNTFLKGMEELQLLNRESTAESGRLFLPLPVLSGMDPDFGQLLIDLGAPPSGEKPENPLVKIAFLLSMSRLGDLRADFAVWENNVSGAFQVSDRETQRLFQENLPLLAQKIQALGFGVQKIDCRLVPPETLAGATLADMLVDGDENLLNIVI